MIRALLLIVFAGLAAPAAGEAILSVPFLPQTEALCGGAATAMVFRFWGDRHADVQQFAPLVDRTAGGIRASALAAAIRERGWSANEQEGSLDTLAASLAAQQPPIVLIEDRPSRYHFVVVIGLTQQSAIVHDPTWGPSRTLPLQQFRRAWAAAQSWMLIVTPPNGRVPQKSAAAPRTAAAETTSSRTDPVAPTRDTTCERALNEALDQIEKDGLDIADRALNDVRQRCPQSAGPIRELAGVRLVQKRHAEASALAREALRLDPNDRYAWDVLGSSLFLQDQTVDALRAWNHIDKPQLDRLDLSGLTRARYSLVAAYTGLSPNTLLTADDYALARRRIEQLPDRVSSAISLRPDADGYATVAASIQESSRYPKGLVDWAAAGLEAAINREVVATIAGWSGQGEAWTASGRWWAHRPRIAGGFAAPIGGRFGGVWRVDGAWEEQTYRISDESVVERRQSGVATLRNWLLPNTRYEARAGLEAWDDESPAVLVGGTLEQRLFRDRLLMVASANRWRPVGDRPAFSATMASVSFRSRHEPRGAVVVAGARSEWASADAPLALWSGAGEGRGRPGLLRAHRLLRGGVIDGPIFGRQSVVGNAEVQRWFPLNPAAIGIAAFSDVGAARHRPAGASGESVLVDVGGGLRARIPGRPETFRVDYARGVRDGANRFTVGVVLTP